LAKLKIVFLSFKLQKSNIKSPKRKADEELPKNMEKKIRKSSITTNKDKIPVMIDEYKVSDKPKEQSLRQKYRS
jgi:hypothetical protein